MNSKTNNFDREVFFCEKFSKENKKGIKICSTSQDSTQYTVFKFYLPFKFRDTFLHEDPV